MSEKKQRRMSKSATIYIPVASLLILLLVILGMSAFLNVIVIEVIGDSSYPAAEIIAASGIKPGDNLLRINIQNAEQSILREIPIFNDAVVSRVFPDTIIIEVRESKPLAAIRYQGDVLIIDSDGRVLERTAEQPRGLIEVRGFTPLEPAPGRMLRPEVGGGMRLQFMMDVLRAVEEEGITGDVSFLDVTSIANITFGYTNRFTVLLGGPENARHKISQLPVFISDAEQHPGFDPGATHLIDMSDPSGRWSLRTN